MASIKEINEELKRQIMREYGCNTYEATRFIVTEMENEYVITDKMEMLEPLYFSKTYINEMVDGVNGYKDIDCAEALERIDNAISERCKKNVKELNADTITMGKFEAVDHPSHYNAGKFEAIDVIEDWDLNFNMGNALKYISRAEHKGNKQQDIEKAIWYLKRELERGRK